MDTNIISTTDMARTRLDWTSVQGGGFRDVFASTPICADATAHVMGGVGHVGGERVFDASVIKPSNNADNISGTDCSPPV